jgi:hypothetical protein
MRKTARRWLKYCFSSAPGDPAMAFFLSRKMRISNGSAFLEAGILPAAVQQPYCGWTEHADATAPATNAREHDAARMQTISGGC